MYTKQPLSTTFKILIYSFFPEFYELLQTYNSTISQSSLRRYQTYVSKDLLRILEYIKKGEICGKLPILATKHNI